MTRMKGSKLLKYPTIITNRTEKQIKNLRTELRRANRRTFRAIVGSAFIISAVLLQGLDGYAPAMLGNAPLLTWMLGGLGAFVLIFSWPSD